MGTVAPLVPFDIATHPGWGGIFQGARQKARHLLRSRRPGHHTSVDLELRINGRMRVLILVFQHAGFRSNQPGIPTPRLVSLTG